MQSCRDGGKKITVRRERLAKCGFVNERVSAINVTYARNTMEDDGGRRRRDAREGGPAREKSEGVSVGGDEEEIKTAKDSLVYDHSEV